jgi:hypothetical protein
MSLVHTFTFRLTWRQWMQRCGLCLVGNVIRNGRCVFKKRMRDQTASDD